MKKKSNVFGPKINDHFIYCNSTCLVLSTIVWLILIYLTRFTSHFVMPKYCTEHINTINKYL